MYNVHTIRHASSATDCKNTYSTLVANQQHNTAQHDDYRLYNPLATTKIHTCINEATESHATTSQALQYFGYSLLSAITTINYCANNTNMYQYTYEYNCCNDIMISHPQYYSLA